MTIEEEFRLSCYEELDSLKAGDHIRDNISLVRHVETGKIYVKKVLSIFNKDVYIKLQKLNLKNIPHIYECIEDDDKLIVIEEYIEGISLREHMERNGLLDPQKTSDIIKKLCDILIILHGQQPAIIHRDIKPDNLMPKSDGSVVLIDFNATKEGDKGSGEDTVLMGTRYYAAPEQYGFYSSDERADIYAIGVMMNEMLTGKPPKTQLAPGFLGQVISKCTKMDREDRYPSAKKLKEVLEKGKETSDNVALTKAPAKQHPNWPVGFRTGNVSNMIVAVIGYGLLIAVCLSINFTSESGQYMLGLPRRIAQLIYLVWLLGEIHILFNYRDINKKNKNTLVGFIVRTIVHALVLFVFVILAVMFIQGIFGIS